PALGIDSNLVVSPPELRNLYRTTHEHKSRAELPMPSAAARDVLCHLRQRLAAQNLASTGENFSIPLRAEEALRPLGLPAIDRVLAGGLALGALHELAPSAPHHLGAAMGFALAVATLNAAGNASGRKALWIQTDFAGLEGGAPYGPGLE